ncbi:MAG TPA: TetR/AcrR family transcriptional regulator [Thermodesulfobacteriota bacterium]
MTAGEGQQPEQTRSEARRLQILEAAQECFRRRGFHGASIAEISEMAGMSTGHIYHYFENKEAIVAAIVEQGLSELLALLDRFRSSGDTIQSILAQVDWGVQRSVEPREAALKLEIVAEAARNPKIAEMVRGVDAKARDGLRETLRAGRRGAPWDESDLDARVEFVMALFEGLTIRAVRHPDLDRAAVARVFRTALRAVLED